MSSLILKIFHLCHLFPCTLTYIYIYIYIYHVCVWICVCVCEYVFVCHSVCRSMTVITDIEVSCGKPLKFIKKSEGENLKWYAYLKRKERWLCKRQSDREMESDKTRKWGRKKYARGRYNQSRLLFEIKDCSKSWSIRSLLILCIMWFLISIQCLVIVYIVNTLIACNRLLI